MAITIDGQIGADYITAGTLSADLIQSGFNKITAGTSITQEGIKQVDASGEYAIMQGGGMRFYTALDTLNGSIESSYQGSEGSGGETGVGIFIEPGRKFVLVRNNPGSEPNRTILEVPKDINELNLRANVNAYGWNIYDANTVRTRNDIHESVFRTLSTGEAFIGGETGTKLGYTEGTSYFSRLEIPKSGPINASGNSIEGINVLRVNGNGQLYRGAKNDPYTGHRPIILSADGTLRLTVGGETILRAFRFSSGTKGAHLFSDLSLQNWDLNDVGNYNNNNAGHLFNVNGSRKLDIDSSGLVMHSQLNMNTHTIINQSDIRLKTKINEAKVNALKEIDRLEFIEWEWDKEKRPDSPDGVQFGIKAQYAPFLQTKAQGEESYLSLDMNKHVSLNSKAVQELYRDHKSLEERVKELEGA